MNRAAFVVVLASACSDPAYVDLTGIYDVDLDVASEPCGLDQPVADPWPFVAIAESTRLSGFWLRMCADATATNCTGDMLIDSLSRPTEDGWLGYISGAEPGTPCMLVFTQQVARRDGEQLTIEIEEHREEAEPTSCSPYEAELRSTLMPCVRHERIVGTRLARR